MVNVKNDKKSLKLNHDLISFPFIPVSSSSHTITNTV